MAGLKMVVCTIVFSSLVVATLAQFYVFNFDNSLEDWEPNRGSWHWEKRDTSPNPLPPSGTDGFAIMDSEYDSDELFSPYFNCNNGGNFSVTFFMRSHYLDSSNMYINIYVHDGRYGDVFLDMNEYSTPDTDHWITMTKELPQVDEPIMIAVFCYNGDVAPPGELLYGCAIDSITAEVYGSHTNLPSTHLSTESTQESSISSTETTFLSSSTTSPFESSVFTSEENTFYPTESTYIYPTESTFNPYPTESTYYP
ncbi:hypothetical protein OTU49_010982 [Cherax quadricarinatus]|uniref:MAM domain-containing protein n=1 Tax=Cherax quadricarinatus TaxID=27406 RepID=A0AAW0W7F7_CHEQU